MEVMFRDFLKFLYKKKYTNWDNEKRFYEVIWFMFG